MKECLLTPVFHRAKKKKKETNKQKKNKNEQSGQINKLTNKKQANEQLHCAYYS